MKMNRVVKRLPVVGAVAAVATLGTMVVSTGIKTVAGAEKGSTAEAVIDFAADVVVSTACLLVL